MKKFIVFIPIIIFLITSCAGTKITSVVDPEYRNKAFSKFLIISTFSDLLYKKEIENSFKKNCLSNNIKAITSLDLIPPTRDYSQEEISFILKENNIDGILIIGLQDYWESQYYMPESSRTTGSAYIIGNYIAYSQQKQKAGGFYYSKPRVTFDCRLFDSKTGQIAWRSTSITAGNAFANFSTLAGSLSWTTVNKLLTDRVVREKREPTSSIRADIKEISENELRYEIKEVELLYSQKEYPEVAIKLSELWNRIDITKEIENRNEHLAKIHFLWGANYVRLNKPKIAKWHFEKVLEYNPDFEIDRQKYNQNIIQIFERTLEFLKEKNIEKSKIQKKPSAQKLGQPSEKIYQEGDKARVIKKGAVLRLEPNDKSAIIRNLPLGALLNVEEISKDWVKIRLLPNKDGIIIVGYIHRSFVKIDLKS